MIELKKQHRGWLYQAFFIVAVLGVGWLLTSTLLDNLARQGIITGFDFLDSSAGFGVIFSLIDYSESDSYGRVFFVGLLNTLLVAGLGIIFATLIGFVVGIARLSNNFLARNLASAYIGLFRNIPLLLHLFFWYFAVLRPLPSPRQSLNLFDAFFLNNRGLYTPRLLNNDNTAIWEQFLLISFMVAIASFALRFLRQRKANQPSTNNTIKSKSIQPKLWFLFILSCLLMLTLVGAPYGIETPQLSRFNFSGGIVVIPEFIALVLALSIYTAAYIAEIVRAGIESVAKGQKEAAQSLGLTPSQSLRYVVIPQALRLIIPPLTNQYLNLTKNSSLAAAIAYPDLVSVFAGTVLNQTGQAVEIIGITMLVYLSISLSISFIMSLYERTTRWSTR
ncbi:MAG: amino acid ABC transporter permease [Moraxellaceae bacterium]|nr:MAG: amino acid ABC transporter permease [Moraxellaceae bacterium]